MSGRWYAHCPNCNDYNYYDSSWTNAHGLTCAMCVNTDHAGRVRRRQAWENRKAEEERKKQAEIRAQQAERQRLVAAAEASRREAERARREAQAAKAAAEKQARESKKHALRMEVDRIVQNLQDVSREFDRLQAVAEEKRQVLDEILEQICIEKSKVIDFSQERSNPRTKTIVLLGMTGEGKSTFGNRLSGDQSERGNDPSSPFGTSDDGDSETSEISKHLVTQCGQTVCVVDTPGLDDTYGRDREHVNNLISWLRGCGGVNQFYFVKMSGNPRFHEMFKRMLRRLEEYLGPDFWRFVTVAVTRVEGHDAQRFDRYSEDLSQRVSREFGCRPVNVVGIGFDDYAAVQNIVQQIPLEKFQCEALKSPVEELEETAELARVDFETAQSELDVVEQRRHSLVSQKQRIEAQLGSM